MSNVEGIKENQPTFHNNPHVKSFKNYQMGYVNPPLKGALTGPDKVPETPINIVEFNKVPVSNVEGIKVNQPTDRHIFRKIRETWEF